MTFSQTIIIGNVGRDPEFRYTPQGVAVCTFSVAVNKITGRGEERKTTTIWFKVTAWRERGEFASQYVKKGMKVMVVGEVNASAYLSKQTNQPMASLEITANNIQLLDSRGEGQPAGDYPAAGGNTNQGGQGGGYEDSDGGDLPF